MRRAKDEKFEVESYDRLPQDEMILRLKAVKTKSGLNWKDFARYFGIPYRTMQDWERGIRKMPDYLLRLMEYKVQMEGGNLKRKFKEEFEKKTQDAE